jgi:RNA polymerase-interacting CarD/CdnL/TRCF family regulator
VSETILGETVGKIHMKKQNLDKMGVRKVTALRETKRSLEVLKNSEVETAVVPKPAAKEGKKKRRINNEEM